MKKRYEEISKSDWMRESLKHGEPDAFLSGVVGSTSRTPWNKGKKKPIKEDGNLWCNCDNPKLVNISGYRGKAFCMLCKNPWYH